MEKCKQLISMSIYFFLFLLLCSCGDSTPIPLSPSPMEIISTKTIIPTEPVVPSPTLSCEDGLKFIDDLTIEDFSVVAPGSTLEKEWLVQNSGSCNWDSLYRIRVISGEALGALQEQALYPARAGTQVTLKIVFTSPLEAGEYFSEWQAFDAKGNAFGDTFYIKIIVQ